MNDYTFGQAIRAIILMFGGVCVVVGATVAWGSAVGFAALGAVAMATAVARV
jgi:hypothetical protein